MRFGADRLKQFGVDQLLQRFLDQIPEQKTDIITAKLTNHLGQSGIMALGHRASPLESTAMNSLRVARCPYRVTDPRPYLHHSMGRSPIAGTPALLAE